MKMDSLFSFHGSWLLISTRKSIVYSLISAEKNNYEKILNYRTMQYKLQKLQCGYWPWIIQLSVASLNNINV